ncbi:MAG: leucine-rich repeat domain-containing protein [Ruminococcaceae bacterium]|nr:leucine-rich repeat domain-containing protein [Oscillospiraceae bacterium]
MKKNLLRTLTISGCILLILFTFASCGIRLPWDDEPEESHSFDALDIESVTDFYNTGVLRLIYLTELTEGNPVTDSSDTFREFSFSVDRFTYDFVADTMPEAIIFRDNMFFASGNKNDGTGAMIPYSSLTKLYENGSLSIESFGDEIGADLSMNDSSADMKPIDLHSFAEALLIGAEDISETDEDGVYRLEESYVDKIITALGMTDEDLTSIGLTESILDELVLTLDFSDYDEKKTFELSASAAWLQQQNISLTFDMSEYDGESKRMSMSLDMLGIVVNISMELEDNLSADIEILIPQANSKIKITIDADEDPEPLSPDTPRENCKSIEISAEITVDNNVLFTAELNMAELEGDRHAGCFAISIPAESAGSSAALLPMPGLGADASDDLSISGSFEIAADDNDRITAIDCNFVIETFEYSLNTSIRADLGKIKEQGSEIASLQLLITDKENPGSDMELTALMTVESYTDDSAVFGLSGTVLAQDAEKTFGATLQFPAAREINLGDSEKTYVERADSLFNDYDAVKQSIDSLNDKAIKYVMRGMSANAPLKYYYYDPYIKRYLFTDISIVGNQVYVNTRYLVDYEKHKFYYAEHHGSFGGYVDSQAMVEAKKIQELIADSQKGHYASKNAQYLVTHYLDEYGLYIVMLAGKPETAVFYTEPVTADMFDGYVLHEIVYDENGKIAIHNFDERYDENCKHFYTCRDCGFELSTFESEHIISEETEILPGNGDQARVTFSICERCAKEGSLILTDKDGNQLRVVLSCADSLSPSPYRTEEYGEKDLVIKGFEHVISGKFYKGRLNIPSITEKTGYRIVGAVPGRWNVSSLPKELILPEGLEFIDPEAFRSCGFSSIILPSTLRSIGMRAFEYCSATEIVIPENVTYIASDAFSMATLERIIVNARYLEFFAMPEYTPALKEIVYNGYIRSIVGSANLPFEVIVIPEGVESVESFGSNRNIKKVIFPSSLLKISDDAFAYCSQLEEVVMNDGLESIGDRAFESCSSLKRIWVAVDGVSGGEDFRFILPDSLKEIKAYAFAGCECLEVIDIPSSVTVIQTAIFENCINLTTVNTHSAITEIGSYAFFGCEKLSDFLMPEGLMHIGDRAFANCIALTDKNVVFGDRLQTIGELAFRGCSGIKNLRLPESVTEIHWDAFDVCWFDSIYVEGKIAFSNLSYDCWGANVDELTLAKGFTGEFPAATIVNIMSTEIPEGESHIVHVIPYYIQVINFAGTEEAWKKGNYRIDTGVTVNFEVSFDEEPTE